MAFETLEATLPAQTAGGATSITMVGHVPSTFSQGSWAVTKLSLTSPTLVTGQATNFVTYNFRAMRAGSSVGTIGTLALSSALVTLPAETEVNVPITGVALVPGDVIDCQMVQSGTGLASPAGVIARAEIE